MSTHMTTEYEVSASIHRCMNSFILYLCTDQQNLRLLVDFTPQMWNTHVATVSQKSNQLRSYISDKDIVIRVSLLQVKRNDADNLMCLLLNINLCLCLGKAPESTRVCSEHALLPLVTCFILFPFMNNECLVRPSSPLLYNL